MQGHRRLQASTGVTNIALANAGQRGGNIPDRMRAAFEPTTAALLFSSCLLFSCLFLQRFGLPLGGKGFSIVGPIGLSLAALFTLSGTLGLGTVRFVAFLILGALALVGVAWHALYPGHLGQEPNLQSLAQFLLLSAFGTLSFAVRVDEGRFFRLVNTWLAFIAVAGLVQFLLQLVGVRVFAFTGIIPDGLLYEAGWNLVIPVGTGDLLKANGFFLVEPSVFSQLMALGLVIEVLAFRRPRFLLLFFAGLLLSFSGTGWIVLGGFLVAAVVGMGWRGIATGAATAAVLAVALAGAAYAFPDLASTLQSRTDEITRPGTSGHLRFVTPFWITEDGLTETPSAAAIGIGAGVSERLTPVYEYDVNTPVKILLEYGTPALIAYTLLFVGGRKSPIQRRILVPVLVIIFIAGAYQQFPPMLFLLLLLVSVARLEPRFSG